MAIVGPLSKHVFGGADYAFHKSQGMTSQALLNWVNSNMSKFSPGPKNQPGGGGLYDQMSADAQAEQRAQAHADMLERQRIQDQAALDKITSNYERQMSALNANMAAQQQQYQTSLSGMQNTMKETQDALFKSNEAQQGMQLKLAAQMNPNSRQKNTGVKSAAKSGVQQQALRRQGIAGNFGREGLRIKGINV
tara:strand:+ start:568 stop:1146 length:579 start_codon:yes stop_codon:yes gene_type:complete